MPFSPNPDDVCVCIYMPGNLEKRGHGVEGLHHGILCKTALCQKTASEHCCSRRLGPIPRLCWAWTSAHARGLRLTRYPAVHTRAMPQAAVPRGSAAACARAARPAYLKLGCTDLDSAHRAAVGFNGISRRDGKQTNQEHVTHAVESEKERQQIAPNMRALAAIFGTVALEQLSRGTRAFDFPRAPAAGNHTRTRSHTSVAQGLRLLLNPRAALKAEPSSARSR